MSGTASKLALPVVMVLAPIVVVAALIVAPEHPATLAVAGVIAGVFIGAMFASWVIESSHGLPHRRRIR